MLPKNNRLKKEEVAEILKKGRVLSSPFFRVKYIASGKETKASGVVSKKISKSAVKRNALRRKIYNVVSSQLEGIKGFSMVIFLQKTPEKDSFLELAGLLSRIKQ